MKYEGACAKGHMQENNKEPQTNKQTKGERSVLLFGFRSSTEKQNRLVDEVTWFDGPCKSSGVFQLHEGIIHRQRKWRRKLNGVNPKKLCVKKKKSHINCDCWGAILSNYFSLP